ncbi:metallophosphoesterase [Pseudomonas sp. LB1P83]
MSYLRGAAILAFSSFLLLTVTDAQARYSVFISDLHFGLGKNADQKWHPYEDFRWTHALEGFLKAISREGNDEVDLVIVGDFLELWQLPDDIHCDGSGAGAGCSVPELVDLTRRITLAHAADLEALKAFSKLGSNKIHVVPGNHDAALLVPEVWAPLATSLDAPSGRVILVTEGIWRSDDKRIVAEHGQQIGKDVNAFDQWPKVTTVGGNGKELMIRPWGERFVQKLFNEQEKQYPVIDNLNPETAGARYRMGDRGLWGSAADVGRFIAFNIFETTPAQKMSLLATDEKPEKPFSIKAAKKSGYRLFTNGLPETDEFRELIEANDASGQALRKELDEMVQKMPDEELEMLCKNTMLVNKVNLCHGELNALVAGLLVPKKTIFKNHLNQRRQQLGDFRLFVYGHTHRGEKNWDVAVQNDKTITVVNTGAFQRLVDDRAFQAIADAKHITTVQALRQLNPEDLKPCYSAVVVPPGDPRKTAKLQLWQMSESGSGGFTIPGVKECL